MIVLVCAAVALVWVTPGWRRIRIQRKQRQGNVDQAVILDLAASALRAGVAIPAMLRAVHEAMEDRFIDSGASPQGRSLEQVANMLLMGATWEESWERVYPIYARLGAVLSPAWRDGVAPVALLERGAQSLRLSRARRAKEAAAKLGSKLLTPLAAFFLPAFMLLGVLPVVVAAAGKLF